MNNSRKRQLIASIESEIQRLAVRDATAPGHPDVSVLKAQFTQLVEALALGPEPETRDCPSCGRKGMRTATVCGYCWAKTPPRSP